VLQYDEHIQQKLKFHESPFMTAVALLLELPELRHTTQPSE
jgi:hypothetical protein